MKIFKFLFMISVILPPCAYAWHWDDFWYTANQQGMQLLSAGKAKAAAITFTDKNWQGVAHYRAQAYLPAFERFRTSTTSDGQYNAGNAAAFMGKFKEAIAAYDKAIALNANNQDAIFNRDIIKKLLHNQKNQPQQKQNQKANSPSDPKSSKANTQSGQNSKRTAENNPAQRHQNQSKPEQSLPQTPKPSGALSRQQRQDENNKQLMQRLADDAGGLLQRKFLRDYAKRHDLEDNSMQGVDGNAVSN